jgi:phosphate starvation-inducible PhoH-like protein
MKKATNFNCNTNKLSFIHVPKTANQRAYVDELTNVNNSVIISVGPAGTGKTLLACSTAIDNLQKNNINKIIITRPVVSVEEEIGFLPGSMEKKMDPWTRPIFDIFGEYYSKSEIANMVQSGVIEISPLGYMRGRTFKNAYIIADEMQNSSPNQMMMLLTRLGTGTKIIVTGDLAQSDRQENNGLKDLINRYKKYNRNNQLENVKLVELNNTDVQRSKIVETMLNLYNYFNYCSSFGKEIEHFMCNVP